MMRMSIEENKNKRKLISRTQTENFIRLRYDKMWYLKRIILIFTKVMVKIRSNSAYLAVHTEIKLRKVSCYK